MPADTDTPNDEPVTLDELTSILRAHEGPPQARSRPLERARTRDSGSPRWRPRLRWTFAAAVVALLVGSGLGFGLGNSVTPSGNAGTPFEGFGFLPARGWTVVQSGTIGSTGAATAIAANVALHPDDGLGSGPQRTLESLRPAGVLIHATFGTRGNPSQDVRFSVAEQPLQVSDARPVSAPGDSLSLVQHRLRAGVGGYNVDVRVYFGAQPSPQMLAAAQHQLSRLVVASEKVTISARPSIVTGNRPVTLSGSVDNGKADEEVTIQAKNCGERFFTGVAAVQTIDGGSWSTPFNPGITTTLRAVWKDASSGPVTLRARAWLQLRRLPASRVFEVTVVGRKQFWHRKVVVESFDRRLGRWEREKSVLLTDQGAFPGYATIRTSARFTVKVPRGTQVRAVLPLSQARPCYLAGTSNPWRA